MLELRNIQKIQEDYRNIYISIGYKLYTILYNKKSKPGKTYIKYSFDLLKFINLKNWFINEKEATSIINIVLDDIKDKRGFLAANYKLRLSDIKKVIKTVLNIRQSSIDSVVKFLELKQIAFIVSKKHEDEILYVLNSLSFLFWGLYINVIINFYNSFWILKELNPYNFDDAILETYAEYLELLLLQKTLKIILTTKNTNMLEMLLAKNSYYNQLIQTLRLGEDFNNLDNVNKLHLTSSNFKKISLYNYIDVVNKILDKAIVKYEEKYIK